MKNKIFWHEIVLFGVVGFLIVWKYFAKNLVFDVTLLWWIMGIVLGFLFIFLDRFIYSFATHPQDPLSMKIKELFGKRKIVDGIGMLINERKEQRELVMRSFLFVGVWIVLAFFTMTSSTNMFARGLMLGMGTHMVFDLTTDFFGDKQRFDLWFWQIKRQIGSEEKNWFFGFTVLIFVILASRL